MATFAMTPPEGSVTRPFSPPVGACAAKFGTTEKTDEKKHKLKKAIRARRKLIKSREKTNIDLRQESIRVRPLPRRQCLGSMAKGLWTGCSWGRLPKWAPLRQEA